ncbi:MAG: hypothetical protein EOP39_02030 [Rubrivivax sp.]|nr:MAG: hypothetical protein EOP39_02030 [Rubrivivax sp.]
MQNLDLPDTPQLEALTQAGETIAFTEGQQAVAVGAQLAEFSTAVPAGRRAVVADCLLLAQLAANKATSMNGDLKAWYDQYLGVLQKLGWLQTSLEFKATEIDDLDAGVHQAILPVLTALLGPAAAAASMVVTVLKGLQEMDKDNPWITLFDRASSHASGAKFQMGFVDADSTGATVSVQLVALAIDANRRITQVLFFRFSSDHARLSVAKGELSVTADRLQALGPVVAERVAPFIADNVQSIDI